MSAMLDGLSQGDCFAGWRADFRARLRDSLFDL
jgi:hypothetical protein